MSNELVEAAEKLLLVTEPSSGWSIHQFNACKELRAAIEQYRGK
jgi:hypothetical protein